MIEGYTVKETLLLVLLALTLGALLGYVFGWLDGARHRPQHRAAPQSRLWFAPPVEDARIKREVFSFNESPL